jgi:hypothetical protein
MLTDETDPVENKVLEREQMVTTTYSFIPTSISKKVQAQ